RSQVNMNLGTGSARSCVSHLPEVVLSSTEENAILTYDGAPDVARFCVDRKSVFFISSENCNVQTIFWKLINFCKKFPSPGNCFLLKVVTERPVTEHLEHRVVICVDAHLFEVVMFAAYAKTFLRVGNAGTCRLCVAKEVVLELD